MVHFFYQFYQNLADTGFWEFVAVITGIGSVWYARRESILVYPVGIISVVTYVFICYQARLYADAGINFFYFVMSVYGWYHWTHKNGETTMREITVNSKKEQVLGIVLSIVSFVLIYSIIWIFKHDDLPYMHSYVPYVDSLTTAIFLVGMWLMALKRLENWVYWILGNIICIPLYFAKGLVFTSIQYVVLLIIAIIGYIDWKKRWRERNLYV